MQRPGIKFQYWTTSQWNLAKFQYFEKHRSALMFQYYFRVSGRSSFQHFVCMYFSQFLPLSSIFFSLSSGRNWMKYFLSSFFHSSWKKPISSGSFRTLEVASKMTGKIGLIWHHMKTLYSFEITLTDSPYKELHSKIPIPSVILGTVTTQWLDSDDVVTIVDCPQHGDYTVDQLCSQRAAGSCQQWLHRHCPVTV